MRELELAGEWSDFGWVPSVYWACFFHLIRWSDMVGNACYKSSYIVLFWHSLPSLFQMKSIYLVLVSMASMHRTGFLQYLGWENFKELHLLEGDCFFSNLYINSLTLPSFFSFFIFVGRKVCMKILWFYEWFNAKYKILTWQSMSYESKMKYWQDFGKIS